MNDQALGDIIQNDVSAELLCHFDALRETPTQHGGPKFLSCHIETVARNLLCGKYESPCHELAHLLAAILHAFPSSPANKRLLQFFWIDEVVTPERFRQAFAKSSHSQIRLTESFLELQLEGNPFKISPKRVGQLAAWMEFLVQVDPVAVLGQAEQTLDTLESASIKNYSNYLQKLLYDYLSKHTQPDQQREHFRELWRWLVQRKTRITAADLTDKIILDFWCDFITTIKPNEADEFNFRRFRSVVDRFLALRDTLLSGEVRRGIDSAGSIGFDAEGEEVSPNTLAGRLESISERTSDYTYLTQPPKFLMQTQLENLSTLVNFGDAAALWPLSTLRYDVFGDWQAQLIQAARNNSDPAGFLNNGPKINYDEHLRKLYKVGDVLNTAFASGLHILLSLKAPEGFGYLIDNMTTEDKKNLLRQLADNQHTADFEFEKIAEVLRDSPTIFNVMINDFYERLPALKLQIPALNKFLKSVEEKFRAVNRAGFKELPDKTRLDSYVAGVNGVLELRKLLETVRSVYSDCVESGQINFDSDLSIFTNMFEQIYGGGNE